MCYNVAIKATREEIAEAFQLTTDAVAAWDGPSDRITLSQDLPAIIHTPNGRILDMMYFGFTPSWWKKGVDGGPKPGNARADTIASTPMFRGSFRHHRCLVPATGFYEWRGEKGHKELVPFSVRDRAIFAFPGIWDEWMTPDGYQQHSVAIITTEANSDMAPYHDRMPVILDKDAEELWMSPEAKQKNLLELLMPPTDGELVAHPELAFKPGRQG